MNAQDVVARYFTCLLARDINALMALYAPQATFTLPVATTYSGREAIRDMHMNAFAADRPTPAPITFVVEGLAVAVQCRTTLAEGGMRETANFYALDADGLIACVSVYMRGPS